MINNFFIIALLNNFESYYIKKIFDVKCKENNSGN